jgi:thiosulfate/3-mercaptopyruvate sulfurtransferase
MPHHVDPLLDAQWLKANLNAPDIRVIDATWFLPNDERDSRVMHSKARLPRAVFFDLDEIVDANSPLPHMLPSPEKFASRMRKLGIGDGARIIVYDATGIFSAARVWWTFRVMGKEDVFVLDGGLPAWEAAGGALIDGPPDKPQERHFTARLRQDLVHTLPEMRADVAAGTRPILDARPPGRFIGRDPEPRPGLRGGHMPGAINLPHAALLTPEGTMKSKPALEAVFADASINIRGPAPICTCGSGVTAAIIALALARVGRWDVPVYDGAWAEWGALADTPIMTETPAS